MDDHYYDFLIVSDRQRAAFDAAFQSALNITRRRDEARRAGERAMLIEARQSRQGRQNTEERTP